MVWMIPPAHHFAASTPIVVLGLNNTSGGSLTAGQVVSVGHAFAQGDVPSTAALSLSALSTKSAVTMQQDRESYWSDGSLKFAVLSFAETDTFSAGQTRNYQVSRVKGSPNRSPFTTLATLSGATDFKLKFYGGDLGGTDIFHVGVNDIITNGTNFPWGSNPLQGWEIVRSGQVCCEWRFWGFLKRDSDNAFHRWVQAVIWVRAWNTGNYEVGGYVRQPNCYGPATGATVGVASSPPRHACNVELYNGASLLGAWGGASDPRVCTFAPAAVTTATGLIALTTAQSLNFGGLGTIGGGVGVILSSSGTLPGGVSGATIYWPTKISDPSNNFMLATQRLYAQTPSFQWATGQFKNVGDQVFNQGVMYACTVSGTTSGSGTGPSGAGTITDGSVTWVNVSPVITSQGAGTHTITPLAATFQMTGFVALSATGQRFWVGSGSQPPLLPVHDINYLFTKTKACPPYDQTLTMYPLSTTPYVHSVNRPTIPVDLEETGDSPGDERIGYFNHTSALMLYQQTDTGYAQNARVLALGWADYWTHFVDERAGQPAVCNQGPNRAGGNYTNLAATNSTFWPKLGANPGSPAAVTLSSAAQDQSGYLSTYGNYVDSPHMPTLWYAPYLRFGDDIYHELGKMQASGQIASSFSTFRNQTFGGTAYGGLVVAPNENQTRGFAWAAKLQGMWDHVGSNGDAMRSYFKDNMDDNSAFLTAWSAAQTGNVAAIGLYPFPDVNVDICQIWTKAMVCLTFGMEAWKGERAGWLNLLNLMAVKFFIPILDSDQGGTEYYAGAYQWQFSADGGVTVYSSIANLLAATNNLGAGWSVPGTGFPAIGSTPPSYTILGTIQGGSAHFPNDTTSSILIVNSGLAMLQTLGIAHASTVRGRINTRIAGLGGVDYSEATSVNGQPAGAGFPEWAFVPFP